MLLLTGMYCYIVPLEATQWRVLNHSLTKLASEKVRHFELGTARVDLLYRVLQISYVVTTLKNNYLEYLFQ